MSLRITMRNYDCGEQQRSASPRIEYLGIDRPIFGKFVNKIRIHEASTLRLIDRIRKET